MPNRKISYVHIDKGRLNHHHGEVMIMFAGVQPGILPLSAMVQR